MDINNNNNLNDIPKEAIETMARRLSNFGAILIGAAVIGVCFSIAKIEDEIFKLVGIALSGLVGAAGIFLMIVASVGAKNEFPKHNFFLYDKKGRKDIALSELTVSLVRERIALFMSSFKRRGKLYIGDLFDERMRIPEHFKTLFCYEILCQMGESTGADPKTFLSFGLECADTFYGYLAYNGDHELALKLKSFILDFSEGKENAEEFVSFLSSQKEYMEGKMLEFTVKNIKKFG